MRNRMQDLDFEQTVAFDSVKDFEFNKKGGAEVPPGCQSGFF